MEVRAYGTAAERAVERSRVEQACRRAARWYDWLKSPECTFQDRENFRRWCADPMNAAAYDSLTRGDFAAQPSVTTRGAQAHDARSYTGGGLLEPLWLEADSG
jgi:ferric-dicitrate binding protein FerR (iron transport regulator)